jgi:formate C-acetyltransferase
MKTKKNINANTAKVNTDTARIDKLKELYRSVPMQLDFERIRIMKETYENTAGYQQIIRRAKFLATVLDRKKIYIDDNLFVGSLAGSLNAIYTHPEWNVEWMKEENTVENSPTEEDREANAWALEYWDKRCLKTRSEEIFQKRYGFSPLPAIESMLICSFHEWPGGGGNLNYPLVYQEGLASVIKDVKERMTSMDMRLENAPKFYFYEACIILMEGMIRFSHRYAKLAREMAAKEKDKTRKAELISLAETCEHVPEHPARNMREALQAHWFSHLTAELEQIGCGYSEAYLGQNMDPYFQADKAAGLIDYDDAVFMIQNLTIKLNELNYYYGAKVSLQNSADLGQSITLGGYTEEGQDATAEMDYVILDACTYLGLPQPPLSLCLTSKTPGKLIEKTLDCIATGVGMPQFVNADVMVKRALHLWGNTKRAGLMPIGKARRTAIGACVGSYPAYETGHPVEGQPNLGKILELTMNDGYDPLTKQQVGPKTGDPETFKDFEELYAAFEGQLQYSEDVVRRIAWIASMLNAEFLPCTWRSIMTKGCVERGIEMWNGGANYYTVSQISVTMKKLKEALAASWEGYEDVRKMCYEEAPKYGNDIDEVDFMVRRVNDSILKAFNSVDGGGFYLDRDWIGSLDQYTKSIHNLMGKHVGAIPSGKYPGTALTDGSLSAMPGTDTKGATALMMSASKGNDPIKWTATHMNCKLPPDQLDTRKGREGMMALVRTLFANGGYHIQFNVLDTEKLREAQKHPENYRDLVVRVAGFSAFFTQLDVGVQNEIIERTLQSTE